MTYEFEGKTEKEAIEAAMNELGLQQNQFDVEILETQKNSLFKKGYVRICVHTLDDEAERSFDKNKSERNQRREENDAQMEQKEVPPSGEFEEKLIEFVKTVIEKMGFEATVNITFREDKKIGLKIHSPDSAILIGKKGKNLDALQLLANVYADHLGNREMRIILDTENYRLRREESLVRMAYSVADKVQQTKRSVLLEPMNPFERRLIHTTLNDIPNIETKSEGEGLYKQVRVIFKGIRR